MIIPIALSLLLAAATPAANAPANNGIVVTLPDAQTAPSPNIHLEHFEYTAAIGHDNAVDYNEMLRLEERLKAVASATLARSQSKFGIRVVYALTADKPAQFRMQVAEAPPVESPRVKQFYDQASALKAFHCRSGTVYILFDYRVLPAVAGHKPKAP